MIKRDFIYWGLIILIIVIAIYYNPEKKKETIIPNIENVKQDSIVRDSIFIEIEKTKTEIRYIEKKHEEMVSNVLSADDSTNLSFFSEYLNDYKRTAQNN